MIAFFQYGGFFRSWKLQEILQMVGDNAEYNPKRNLTVAFLSSLPRTTSRVQNNNVNWRCKICQHRMTQRLLVNATDLMLIVCDGMSHTLLTRQSCNLKEISLLLLAMMEGFAAETKIDFRAHIQMRLIIPTRVAFSRCRSVNYLLNFFADLTCHHAHAIVQWL